MLHSNLLGRLGNGLLKFVVLVVMTCNMSGAFAETIEGDVTVNPGETLTITSEVTITGNLINNGGTINVGEGGVLTVNGNVTNTSVQNDTYVTFSEEKTYEYKRYGSWSSCSAPATPENNKHRRTITEKSRNLHIGIVTLSNGGVMNINGNLTNNTADITITSTDSEQISYIKVNGNVNTTATTINYTEKGTTTRATYSGNKWKTDDGYPKTITPVSKSFSTSNITLTNGYLLVDGNLNLQDNSTVTFAGTGIGEDIESTIRVRNISGTEGNVTQSANAVITLNSGAKGSLITQGTYTDKTNPLSDEKHPWNINQTSILGYTTGFNFVVNNNFNLTVNSYAVSTDASASGSGFGDWFVGLFGGGDRVKNLLNNVLTNLETKGVEKVNLSDLIAQVSELLPIELTSFTATATNNGFVLNWVTASEVENDYYTLEYSIDGVDFNEIDYVHGAGTTSETSEYEYRWDEAPEFDVVYFRLKQTDYNGEYSYSDVIVASRKKSSGANGTFRYGPLNLQIQDGELRYIVK